jgi:uncharacterized protein
MTPAPHLTAEQLAIVRAILRRCLPTSAQVRVFGSRATGIALKPYSDLDLLITAPAPLPLATVAELREAFSQSDLPFAVDLLEHHDAAPAFLARLGASGAGLATAEIRLDPLPQGEAPRHDTR